MRTQCSYYDYLLQLFASLLLLPHLINEQCICYVKCAAVHKSQQTMVLAAEESDSLIRAHKVNFEPANRERGDPTDRTFN